MSPEKKTPETIDLTPTWAAVMPILIYALKNGTEEGKASAEKELKRLAQNMDKLAVERKNLHTFAVAFALEIAANDPTSVFTDAHVNYGTANRLCVLAGFEGLDSARLAAKLSTPDPRHVTMYHGGPSHDWIFTSYHGCPVALEQIWAEVERNGYNVQRDNKDGRLYVRFNGDMVAVIQ